MESFAPQLADELENNGFVHAIGALDPGLIDSLLLRAHAALFRESAASREAVKSNGSLIHLADNPEFADIIGSPELLKLLWECGATDPRFTGGFLISKPGGGPPLFWHQDWWGWDSAVSYLPAAQQLFVMIYLTDTHSQNGCLRVIPGSHRSDHELHHLDAAHSEGMQGYKDPSNPAYADHPEQLAVPVRAGDVLIGDARLIHGAFANRTNEERPLLTLWFMPHWEAMPACMRALAYKGFMRGDDIASSVAQPQTFLDWPEPLKRRIAHLLPPDDGGVAPMRWNRVPDFVRLAA
ncbi:MAG TPA: phytanoyl-CoA dioxygenase family protein [Sphingomicrobium sp.]|nr:phytanoyl-CoA dioxygenase family protein [Sphingomicrobium sp.]